MISDWNNAIITDIAFATYVKPCAGKPIHANRPFHGFVINDDVSDKNIYFSDGTVLHAGPNEVHYLPKNSSYRIETITPGGCWAINFDVLENINEKPFTLKFRNHEAVLKDFVDIENAWKENKIAIIRKCLYDIIIKIDTEINRTYTPLKKQSLIKPAVDHINQNFTENMLTIKELAKKCGITEAYFRRIFIDIYSLSPKEYIIKLRTNYAKQLLETNEFSITEIALMCGYFEPCHFSREFKKRFGISPNEYAKQKINIFQVTNKAST